MLRSALNALALVVVASTFVGFLLVAGYLFVGLAGDVAGAVLVGVLAVGIRLKSKMIVASSLPAAVLAGGWTAVILFGRFFLPLTIATICVAVIGVLVARSTKSFAN